MPFCWEGPLSSYLRIYADEQGESHFEDVVLESAPVSLTFPELFPAKSCSFVSVPATWDGGVSAHPSPQWLFACTLTGQVDIQTSDGEMRHIEAPHLMLLEDLQGKGHTTRFLRETQILFVVLDEEARKKL
jgi:hypothetical protein